MTVYISVHRQGVVLKTKLISPSNMQPKYTLIVCLSFTGKVSKTLKASMQTKSQVSDKRSSLIVNLCM